MKTDDTSHTYCKCATKQKLRHTHKHTFFDDGKGNMPVATVHNIIVEFGAPDGPARPRALCYQFSAKTPHAAGRKQSLTSFTPDSLGTASFFYGFPWLLNFPLSSL